MATTTAMATSVFVDMLLTESSTNVPTISEVGEEGAKLSPAPNVGSKLGTIGACIGVPDGVNVGVKLGTYEGVTDGPYVGEDEGVNVGVTVGKHMSYIS